MNRDLELERLRTRQIRQGTYPITHIEYCIDHIMVRSTQLPVVKGGWCFLDTYSWQKERVTVEDNTNGVYRIRVVNRKQREGSRKWQ